MDRVAAPKDGLISTAFPSLTETRQSVRWALDSEMRAQTNQDRCSRCGQVGCQRRWTQSANSGVLFTDPAGQSYVIEAGEVFYMAYEHTAVVLLSEFNEEMT